MTPPKLFDPNVLMQRRRRALAAPAGFLLRRVAEDTADRLGAVLRDFDASSRSARCRP